MAFEPIQRELGYRLEGLAKTAQKTTTTNQVVKKYLDEQYGPGIAGRCRVEYQQDDKTLFIATPSKTIANDLTLRAGELSSLLRADGLAVGQIVIR